VPLSGGTVAQVQSAISGSGVDALQSDASAEATGQILTRTAAESAVGETAPSVSV
jgi:hypothetical protein